MSKTSIAVRFSLFYGAFFSVLGVYGPFWPVWLRAKGLSATDIGALITIGLVLKVILVPLITQLADRRGDRKGMVLLFLVTGLSIFSLFHFTQGFWSIVAISLLYSAAWSGVMPLGEGLAVVEAKKHGLHYGRLRLWGSASFILGSVGGGWLLTGRSEDIIYWLMLGCLGATVAVGCLLPNESPKPETKEKTPLIDLLKNPAFMTCVAAATLIQASHTVYYAFSTLHWRGVGHTETIIGLLWGEGVLVEIALFAFGATFITRMGPGKLLMIAGLAGVVRWGALASTTSVEFLIPIQLLHALTFGITHLAIIDYVMHRVPGNNAATAMGVYTATAFGIGSGLSMYASGYLFESLGGAAFWGMAIMSGFGFLMALYHQLKVSIPPGRSPHH